VRIALPIFEVDGRLSINFAYVQYIAKAGFEPVLVNNLNDLQKTAKECDGLLLPGGVDIEPTFYGENNFGSENCDLERDDFERKILHTFLAENKKVFGICRGYQLIVREFLHVFHEECVGMSFWQHINGHSLAQTRNIKRNVTTHNVTINTQQLYGIKQDKKLSTIFVNSMHHQALLVDGPHNLSKVINKDNYIKCIGVTDFSSPTSKEENWLIAEAVEIKLEGSLMRGVQWHPEELEDVGLLTNFFTGVANVGGIKLYN
jgi:putative glutamine amidotransferase